MTKRIVQGMTAAAATALIAVGVGAAPASAHNSTYSALTGTLASCQSAMSTAQAEYTRTGHNITTWVSCAPTGDGKYKGSFYYYHNGDPV